MEVKKYEINIFAMFYKWPTHDPAWRLDELGSSANTEMQPRKISVTINTLTAAEDPPTGFTLFAFTGLQI